MSVFGFQFFLRPTFAVVPLPQCDNCKTRAKQKNGLLGLKMRRGREYYRVRLCRLGDFTEICAD
ncbi:MAG: hypothetical protein CMJ19_07620 [Phycisphaeraceae bacterium]|nr:hypothetical protein [Phycisphaeraceae bacterium]